VHKKQRLKLAQKTDMMRASGIPSQCGLTGEESSSIFFSFSRRAVASKGDSTLLLLDGGSKDSPSIDTNEAFVW